MDTARVCAANVGTSDDLVRVLTVMKLCRGSVYARPAAFAARNTDRESTLLRILVAGSLNAAAAILRNNKL
jgi:hypothetical protein